jgi:hypothetical protein
MTVFTFCMWFPHITIDFVLVLDMFFLYFLAIRFRCYAMVCNSSSEVAIRIWLSAYNIVLIIFLLVSFLSDNFDN